MIKNIIFDFGDIFINLDKTATLKSFQKLGLTTHTNEHIQLEQAYEKGEISTESFLQSCQKFTNPEVTTNQIQCAWNAILLDFPKQRLAFLKNLKNNHNYRLFLLSNTNALHIDSIIKNVPFYEEFKNCFEVFYLSHEIGMRKPNLDIFEFVLFQNKLLPHETLFIDDTLENIQAAEKLGIQTWHLQVEKQDVSELLTKL